DLPVTDGSFAAIQYAAIQGFYPLGSDLHAAPDAPMTRAEAAVSLAAWAGEKVNRAEAMKLAVDRGWMAVDHRNWFHADLPLLWTDVRMDKLPRKIGPAVGFGPGPVKRRDWAWWITTTK
ncbi:MAG: hypothetical protein JSR81_04215, partial [Proteobacteria bacterium]|nr:hypothetical protein [Pseudomonadota bacterium]